MSYRWDVFISYSRNGNVTDWVRNHLHPALVNCLEDELNRPPQVFIDTRMEVGDYWPDELADALQTTRYLLAVWSPAYFTSRWCVAEWQTILAREHLLGIPCPEERFGLIYPVVFSDGDSFPPEANKVQQRIDLSRYGIPYKLFRETDAYTRFNEKVREIAADLARRFDSAPQWRPDWPVHRPDPHSEPPLSFPRLGAA